jgi:hypothetical protein
VVLVYLATINNKHLELEVYLQIIVVQIQVQVYSGVELTITHHQEVFLGVIRVTQPVEACLVIATIITPLVEVVYSATLQITSLKGYYQVITKVPQVAYLETTLPTL